MVTNLAGLPVELMHEVLIKADPLDVHRFGLTCKRTHTFLLESDILWKDLFTAAYDAPSTDPAVLATYDYRSKVQDRVRARTLASQDGGPITFQEAVLVCRVMLDLNEAPLSPTGTSRNSSFMAETLARINFKEMWKKTKQDQLKGNLDPDTAAEGRLLNDIHRIELLRNLAPEQRIRDRTIAKEICYRSASYGGLSSWGPFMRDPQGRLRVNWTVVNGIAIAMGQNVTAALEEGWGIEDPFAQASGQIEPVQVPRFTNETTRPRAPDLGPSGRDWAGVEAGPWRGTYAFLDYRVFEDYNFNAHPGSTSSLEDETEAVGDCMQLDLTLLPEGKDIDRRRDGPPWEDVIDMADSDTSDDEGASTRRMRSRAQRRRREKAQARTSALETQDHESKKPLAFAGTSLPLSFAGTFANSFFSTTNRSDRRVRGTVSLDVDGVPHWEMIISYGGTDQWLMHGVQVAVGAQMGILGIWSTARHEEDGPNGPFWYWPTKGAPAT